MQNRKQCLKDSRYSIDVRRKKEKEVEREKGRQAASMGGRETEYTWEKRMDMTTHTLSGGGKGV